jgi:hypothetical protein
LTRLNQHAKQALEILGDKHRAFLIAKLTIEAELKNELNERLSSFRQERDTALRLAAEAGVPRTQLGKAIGTSNYRTVQEILALTDDNVIRPDDLAGGGKWSLLRLEDGVYSLDIFSLGSAGLSGKAQVTIDADSITFVDGDGFVVPAVYREGLADEIVASVG